jgi:hypothetical protein
VILSFAVDFWQACRALTATNKLYDDWRPVIFPFCGVVIFNINRHFRFDPKASERFREGISIISGLFSRATIPREEQEIWMAVPLPMFPRKTSDYPKSTVPYVPVTSTSIFFF